MHSLWKIILNTLWFKYKTLCDIAALVERHSLTRSLSLSLRTWRLWFSFWYWSKDPVRYIAINRHGPVRFSFQITRNVLRRTSNLMFLLKKEHSLSCLYSQIEVPHLSPPQDCSRNTCGSHKDQRTQIEKEKRG